MKVLVNEIPKVILLDLKQYFVEDDSCFIILEALSVDGWDEEYIKQNLICPHGWK